MTKDTARAVVEGSDQMIRNSLHEGPTASGWTVLTVLNFAAPDTYLGELESNAQVIDDLAFF